jgi:hypothetical protein
VPYHVLFFIHLESCRVAIAGITVLHPDKLWMKQMARNVMMRALDPLVEGGVPVQGDPFWASAPCRWR